MVRNEELMQCLIYYGRGIPQDFVTRSRNINDVICYLRAECQLEILKLTSFVTTNLINFQKITVSQFTSCQTRRGDSIGDALDVNHADSF